ncbi:MAG: hypothetical protein LBQ60_18560 [Bacteroidales bacterium]|jgi:hypothetical protein|nr:hypothetical protein [Bacteroidales bacterium]
MARIIVTLLFFTIFFNSYAQDKIKSTGQIPILAWHGIPCQEMTVERFKEQKAAGFNLNFSVCRSNNELPKVLDAAHKAGIQLIISTPELRNEPEKTVKRFMNHPAVAGYFLKDEPTASEFAELGAWARRIQAVDNQKFCYLNLFPTGEQGHINALGVKDYREYISRFDKEVPLPFLSFDHYPIINDTLKAEWYENLEEFSDEARKVGKKFWAFALATEHKVPNGKYPVPTLAMLRLQMYSNLAYGAQGLQYFTYWTPRNNTYWDFQHGPIGLDGKRTEVYDLVKEMNEELNRISGVFLGAKVLSVQHTGNIIPRKRKGLPYFPKK